MLRAPRNLTEARIKALKKMALQVVPLLPDDQKEAEYVLGVAMIHVAYMNDRKGLGTVADQLDVKSKLLEFTQRYRSGA